MAEEQRSALDQALDLLLFAPLGLLLTARNELPEVVAKGRQHLTGQLLVAKMIGEFAVRQGQKEAEKAAARFADQAGTVVDRLGGLPGAPGTTGGAAAAPMGTPRARTSPGAPGSRSVTAEGSPRETPSGTAPSNGSPRPAAGRRAPGAVTGARAAKAAGAKRPPASSDPKGGSGGVRDTPVPTPAVNDLAIPGYDSLSASQVVQRLGGLAGAELEAVARYEVATRGRRTILSKIAQLQDERH